MSTLLGGLMAGLGGLSMGTSPWTLKALRKLQFEHWLLISMFVGLVLLPWGITCLFCPSAFQALRSVPPAVLLEANAFAFGWGVANVLCCICFVRIGVALTGGILSGIGTAFGVTVPMVFKASGLFERAPDLGSRAGAIVMAGVGVMLAGVALIGIAGFGRERTVTGRVRFSASLLMAAVAGVLSTGPNFAFAYSQAPIVAAMKHYGASDIPALAAVWAVGMLAGALVNLLYPAFLITKNRSWELLRYTGWEILLPAMTGIQFCCAIVLLGTGNLALGALGASVGWGIYQAAQTVGNQGTGFLSGEWRQAGIVPRRQMYAGVALLLIAASIMAYANSRY